MDNGSGRFRGIYAQENLAAMPIFEAWLAPFHDVGATTVATRNTGSTDHISFDRIGLPGFQFIQDRLDYFTNVHHSHLDTWDHAEPEDLKQAAAIVASFAYNAAMREPSFPRRQNRKGTEGLSHLPSASRLQHPRAGQSRLNPSVPFFRRGGGLVKSGIPVPRAVHDLPHPLRPQSHWLPAHRWCPHRAVLLAGGPSPRRRVRAAHRGHRPRTQHPGRNRRHPGGDGWPDYDEGPIYQTDRVARYREVAGN